MKNSNDFLGQPIRSLQTMLRTIADHSPGYEFLVPDGIYGKETKSAVSTFQRRHSLSDTGITNQETWDAIVEEYDAAITDIEDPEPLIIDLSPNAAISAGQSDPCIMLVQTILNILGSGFGCFNPPAISGILDDDTNECLRKFQEMSGIPQTGSLDKYTWKHLALLYPIAAERCKHR